MIEAVTIKNFRSISNVTISDLGLVNVFVGANDVGKSNLLTAIFYGASLLSGPLVEVCKEIGNNDADFHQRNLANPIEICFNGVIEEQKLEVIAKIFRIDSDELFSGRQKFLKERDVSVSMLSTVILNGIEQFNLTEEMVDIIAIASLSQDRAFSLDLLINALLKCPNYFSEFGVNGEMEDVWKFFCKFNKIPHTNSYLQSVFRETWVDSKANCDAAVKMLREKSSGWSSVLSTIKKRLNDCPMEMYGNFWVTREFSPIRSLLDSAGLIGRDLNPNLSTKHARRLLEAKQKRQHVAFTKEIIYGVSEITDRKIDAFIDNRQNVEIDIDDFSADFVGSGIHDCAKFVVELKSLNANSLVCIEEPETHLHHDLQNKVMDYICRRNTGQTFITTHSTAFIPDANENTVFLVSRPSTYTQVVRLENGDESDILKHLGIGLKSLFLAQTVVFVESLTDELVMKTFAKLLNLPNVVRNAGFVHIEGSSNIFNYASLNALNILKQRDAHFFIVVDRDEKNQDSVSALRLRLEPLAKVFVLEKREIENYLLIPSAVLQALREKDKGTNNQLRDCTEEQISKLFDETAEKFKSYTINKLFFDKLKPKIPSRLSRDIDFNVDSSDFDDSIVKLLDVSSRKLLKLKEEISAIRSEVDSFIEERWKNEKMSLVPGEQILESAYYKFGLRFVKTKDSVKIAEAMQASHVDKEFQQLLMDLK